MTECSFTVKERVVYPGQGVGEIIEISEKKFKDEMGYKKRFLKKYYQYVSIMLGLLYSLVAVFNFVDKYS